MLTIIRRMNELICSSWLLAPFTEDREYAFLPFYFFPMRQTPYASVGLLLSKGGRFLWNTGKILFQKTLTLLLIITMLALQLTWWFLKHSWFENTDHLPARYHYSRSYRKQWAH